MLICGEMVRVVRQNCPIGIWLYCFHLLIHLMFTMLLIKIDNDDVLFFDVCVCVCMFDLFCFRLDPLNVFLTVPSHVRELI